MIGFLFIWFSYRGPVEIAHTIYLRSLRATSRRPRAMSRRRRPTRSALSGKSPRARCRCRGGQNSYRGCDAVRRNGEPLSYETTVLAVVRSVGVRFDGSNTCVSFEYTHDIYV